MSKIICFCNNVSLDEIELAIKNGAASLDDIKKVTGACNANQCKDKNPSGKCCSSDILALLQKPNTSTSCSCCC